MLQTDVHCTSSNHQIKWSVGCHAAVWFRIVNNKVCLFSGVHCLEAYWRTTVTSVTNDQRRVDQLVWPNMAEFDWNLERHSSKNAASPRWLLYSDWMVNEMVRKKFCWPFCLTTLTESKHSNFFLPSNFQVCSSQHAKLDLVWNILPVCQSAGHLKATPHITTAQTWHICWKKIFSSENCELMNDSTLGHFI